jgi:hypothetical protein
VRLLPLGPLFYIIFGKLHRIAFFPPGGEPLLRLPSVYIVPTAGVYTLGSYHIRRRDFSPNLVAKADNRITASQISGSLPKCLGEMTLQDIDSWWLEHGSSFSPLGPRPRTLVSHGFLHYLYAISQIATRKPTIATSEIRIPQYSSYARSLHLCAIAGDGTHVPPTDPIIAVPALVRYGVARTSSRARALATNGAQRCVKL